MWLDGSRHMSKHTTQQINFTLLAFPSDQLTIGSIRQCDPEEFAQESPRFFDTGHADVSSMLWMERCLAHNAFAKAIGQPLPHAELPVDRDEVIETLNRSYLQFGLTSGLEHTKQLIRTLESTAAQQADIKKIR